MTAEPAVDQHTPNWAPLEAVIPLNDCADWMWMGHLEHDGQAIEQYKHRDTRRYLNLDADGNAYRVEYPTGDWDPWCGVPLADVAQLPPTVEPMPFAEALDRALS